MTTFDKNKSGKITFVEFIEGMAKLSSGGTEEDKLKFCFQIYDNDGDGKISQDDLQKVLKMMVGNNLNDQQLHAVYPKVQKQHFNHLILELLNIENKGKYGILK